jgi:membrane protein implicated in regulation of membrane protease activity
MDRRFFNARRIIGGIALLGALFLLLAGETVLKHRLAGVPYILYWLACLVLTVVAIIAAFLDVRALQRRTRQEQQVLIEETFREIADKNPNSRRRK